jgi:hypothetical protein
MRNVMARIRSAGSTAAVEAEIAPLPELFDLQRMGELLSRQERYDELAAEYQSLARSHDEGRNGNSSAGIDQALRRRIGDQQRTQADRSSV